jgi:hypothetical protein
MVFTIGHYLFGMERAGKASEALIRLTLYKNHSVGLIPG